MTFTRSRGFLMIVTSRLPRIIAIPEQEVTIPSTPFPLRGITSAGRTALKAEEIRFTPDMNRITCSTSGFVFRK